MARVARSYTIQQKTLALVRRVGVRAASDQLCIARGTIYDWINQAGAIYSFTGNAESKTLKGRGRKEIFPGVLDVVTYMKDVRRPEQVLSTAGICQFMWQIHPEWMESYISGKAEREVALERMVQRLANR
ncbi:hypothetical protein PF001_g646 [Phytophthora fragariae]|uniref:HTH psq-type domain-containing protein n=1 Tax=Phytophthora fragariae TaxID=53985 RepID=A0A6A4EZ89_9STRA|nr:hypothetical protein PF001_g646 [Phytophthora fragariae]